MKSLLLEEAKSKCKVEHFFDTGREIKIAPLQISKSPPSSDTSGHYSTRREISQCYSETPKHDLVPAEKLFDEAEKLVSENPSCPKKHGNIVGIVGEAGVGKTTLTKLLLQHETSAQQPWFGAEFIISVSIRDLTYSKEMNFLKFCLPKSTAPWINHKDIRDHVLESLAQSSKVLLIMDDFDEANLDFATKSNTISLLDDATAEDFIGGILSGDILPNAKKVITSRPRQMYALREDLRPRFVVTVVGLDEEAQKNICRDICKGNEKFVLDFIRDHPNISSYCFVPVNCILTMFCIDKFASPHKCHGALPPESSTGVMIVVLSLFAGRMKERKDLKLNLNFLKSVAGLAEKGFSENKYYFTEEDLEAVGLKQTNEMTTFLTTILREDKYNFLNFSQRQYSYFTHSLWQELFVAIYYILNHSLSNLTYEDLSSSRYENVSRFMFGLCNVTSYDFLKRSFPQLPSNLDSQAKQLQDLTLKNLPNLGVLNEGSCEKFLMICSWANELCDKKFSKAIAEKINEEFFMQKGQILPSDIPALHHVLRSRSDPLSISLGGLYLKFIGNCFTLFLKELQTTLDSTSIMVIRSVIVLYVGKLQWW